MNNIEELADALYRAGYESAGKRDFDPRNCDEWAAVVEVVRWRTIETAPYETPVLGFLYLPKNPIASSPVIATRCYVEADEPESYGSHRRTVGCCWANGLYYRNDPAEARVTHWMPLPEPPSKPEATAA